MKLNAKIYRQLTNEPFESQQINGKTVEFHYMDDSPFLAQFASRGRFAVWTSDGNNYKVLIESTYYEALKPFYEYDVNVIWLTFLEKISTLSRKINRMFIIPTLLIYAVGAILAIVFFQDQTLPILLGLVILVVVSNMVQSRMVNKKVKEENESTQDKIRGHLGQETFDNLVTSQEEHYQAYFKFDETIVDENEETHAQVETKDQNENPNESTDGADKDGQ